MCGLLLANFLEPANPVLAGHVVVIAQLARKIEHLVLKRSDKILGKLAFVDYNPHYLLHKVLVQSSVYLVENVERRRLAFLKRHQQTDSDYSLLTS